MLSHPPQLNHLDDCPPPITDTTALTEIAKTWSIFPVSEASPISLRALRPSSGSSELLPINRTFTARDFPKVQDRQHAFEQSALELNQVGYNTYIVMNPIRPDFCGNAVSDRDIACRQRLLIDLDRTSGLDAPATDAEIDAAADVAHTIIDYFRVERGFELHRMMSGNGHHIYIPLNDIPNDSTAKTLCQQFLMNLARRFNTTDVKVDTSVFNASRITKVPGTIARKGLEAPGRPYRMARVL